MKLLKKIILSFLVFFALLCLFIIVCAFRPDLAETLSQFLYPESSESYVTAQIPETGQEENATIASVEIHGEEVPEMTPAAGDAGNLEEAEVYVPPAQSAIKVPKEVAGKSGYRPLQEDSKQIEDAEAAELRNQLGTGESGDGLTFDSQFYPYYAMLSEEQQAVYRQVFANAAALHPSFSPIAEIHDSELRKVMESVYNDHPELFWLDTAYAATVTQNGRCVEISLQFNRTAQDLETAKKDFDAAANAIITEAQNREGSYEKELYVHNALVERAVYSLEAPMNQSAYSALVTGQTVCAGYARAFQYLMQQLGIPCYYCTGYAGEDHAWNIIALEDGFYNVDATWDDTEPGSYDYFNKTDADFADTHLRQDLSIYLPACTGEAYQNLEQQAVNEDAIENLADYYNNCYEQMLQAGFGTYQFTNLLQGKDLLEECYQAYQSDAYRQGYVDAVLTQLDASSCDIRLSAQELQGDSYLIIHDITVR